MFLTSFLLGLINIYSIKELFKLIINSIVSFEKYYLEDDNLDDIYLEHSFLDELD